MKKMAKFLESFLGYLFYPFTFIIKKQLGIKDSFPCEKLPVKPTKR